MTIAMASTASAATPAARTRVFNTNMIIVTGLMTDWRFGLAALLRRYPFRGKTIVWKAVASSIDRRTVVARLPGGGRMQIDTSTSWQRQMLPLCFERRSIWLVGRLLRPGDIFIDGGANCGVFTCLAAGLVAPTGQVVSFEPDPRLHAQLLAQRALNAPFVSIEPVALSSAEGTAPFHMNADDLPDGWGVGTASLEDRPGWRTIDVPTRTLDGYITRAGWPTVALAKLDLEGHERPALEGARESLASGRLESLLIEVNDRRVVETLRPYHFDAIVDVRNGFRSIASLDELGDAHTDVLFARGACFERWQKAKWMRGLV
jgi:FkbM family methyltransferase